ncbi:MAG: hypothetical protein IPQ07_02005 [Myxococcales bacterium]|nr:hypothetical protein [Myxococcales bacterium]
MVPRGLALLVGLVGPALAGCGEVTARPDAAVAPPDAPDLYEGAVSGTRLKLRYVDFGTVRTLAGVRDMQRNEDCTPTPWSGGKAYCVPQTGGVVYANATCSQRLGQVFHDSACTTQKTPPAYFVENQYLTGCELAPAHLYARGTKVAATQYYFKSFDGSCAGPFITSSSDYYAVGAEVATTELAETPLSAPATTGRLGQRFYESADGLRYPVAYRVHDALLGVECYPDYVSAGATSGRCVPEDAAFAGDFRDAACTLPAVSVNAGCTAAKFAVSFGACPYDEETYYPLGPKLTPTLLYYQSGASCTSYTPTAGDSYYGVGAPVTLATLTRSKGTGARLEPIFFSTAEGLKTRDNPLYDEQLQAECFPTTQANGTIVCMPRASSISTFYTDAACTAPLQLMGIYRGAATCSPPPLPSYGYETIKDTATCGTTYALHTVGQVYTGLRYRKSGTTCTADTGTTTLYYRVNATLPDTAMVAGTAVIDPQ